MPAIRSRSRARYDEEGADELTFLDITAIQRRARHHPRRDRARRRRRSSSRSPSAAACASVEDVRKLLNAGADKVSINTAAVENPDARRASRRAASARRHRGRDRRARRGAGGGWEVYTHGGRKARGLDAVEWAREMARARRRRDPAHQHGPRRHARAASTSSSRARSPTRSPCR